MGIRTSSVPRDRTNTDTTIAKMGYSSTDSSIHVEGDCASYQSADLTNPQNSVGVPSMHSGEYSNIDVNIFGKVQGRLDVTSKDMPLYQFSFQYIIRLRNCNMSQLECITFTFF